jgi:hypothetical protein
MNSAFFRAAAVSLLLAVLPGVTRGQTQPQNAASAGETPASTLQTPPVGGASATLGDVRHVRQLVRDVESNTDNIKSKGDFGAQLWLIQNPQFFQDWIKPPTPSIDPVTIAPRGQNIYTVIIFYGPAHDTAGLSNISYDITVLRPNGSIYSQSKNLIGWQGLAPQESRSLELGRDHIAININPTDPSGLYTVSVLLRDNVSRVELPLKQTFVVQ